MLVIVVNAYFMTSLPYRPHVFLVGEGREQVKPDPVVSLALSLVLDIL